jgi:hypothetical protein
MKNILLLFFLTSLSKFCLAQNWKTIIANDTIFYKVIAVGNDSDWNGYLRNIYIDSQKVIVGIETNYLYPSLRLDINNVMDTLKGDSWIGKINERNSQGEEYYYNRRNEAIVIKTLANLNDSWLFSTDSLGNTYQATISSLDTMSINGVLDSIKLISIQAYNGTSQVMSVYNNLPIILSKSHGMVQLFEFYCFPYQQIAEINAPYEVLPKLPLVHVRINKDTFFKSQQRVDLALKYKPGNEWISYHIMSNSPGSGGLKKYIRDSIISSLPLSPSAFMVEHYIDSFFWYEPILGNPNNFPPYHTYTTRTDTFTNNLIPGLYLDMFPESKASCHFIPGTIQSRHFSWKSINRICDLYLYRDTIEGRSPNSGNFNICDVYLEKFGQTKSFWHSYDGSNSTFLFYDYLYIKLDACEIGTYFNFKTLDVSSIQAKDLQIDVYPNPSNGIYTVQSNLSLIKNIRVLDLQLRTLLNQQFSTNTIQIDLQKYSSNLFFVEIELEEGIIYRKLSKK